MQLTANFFQQAANPFTVSELTRSIRNALPLVIPSEVEESLKVFRNSKRRLDFTQHDSNDRPLSKNRQGVHR
jgi:hypothetical protein